jgi:hypothetical protein
VATPVRVLALHDLTLPSLLEARDKPFTTALLFTTINPQRYPLSQRLFGRANRAYFNLHDDAPPEMAARALGGTLTWQRSEMRQYCGVIQINVPVDALLK